jgi:hypothetical protein
VPGAPVRTGRARRRCRRIRGGRTPARRSPFAFIHNRSLRELLDARAIRHLRTRPHTPRTNGKVERYQQTLQRERAYALEYASSDAHRASLPQWVRQYHERGRERGQRSGRGSAGVPPRFSVKKIVCGRGSGAVFGDGSGLGCGWAAIV